MTTDDKREELILEAQKAFDCILTPDTNTELTMIGSDHGFAAWTIAPLRVTGPTALHPRFNEPDVKTVDEQAILSIEDAGESQKRLILLILEDEPFLLVHTYFMDDVKTYEITEDGRIDKPHAIS